MKFNKDKDYYVVDMNKVNYVDKIDDTIKEGIQQGVHELQITTSMQI